MITGILRCCAGIVLTLSTAWPQDVAFFREYSAGPEQPSALATDGTAYYVVGGDLPSYSAIPCVATPGFLRKLDALGNEMWVRRFSPSTLLLRPYGVAVYSGAVYTAGYSGGDFSTRTAARAFLSKYDASGTELWTREFGSDRDTAACGVAADVSGVYVTGEGGVLDRADAPVNGAGTFVRKYDHSGQLLWTRQITFGLGFANGIAVDGGRVYVVGASRQGSNALLSYSSDGAEGWTTPIGPGSDFDSALAADSSGVYLAHNGFLTSCSLDGSQRWRMKYADAGARVALTPSGIYVTGRSWKPLPGRCVYGGGDVIVRKYDRGGGLLWTRVFGGLSGEGGSGLVATDGVVYVSGWVQRSAPGPSAFFAKLDENAVLADGSPRILWDCVANAGSYEASAVSPGEIVVINGSSIGPPQLVPLRIEDGRVTTSLADTRVLFNGTAAPIIYASEKQTSAIVPNAIASANSVNVQIEYRGVRSNVVTLPVVDVRPGMFTADGSGLGQVAALNEDGSVNSPANPAARGSIISLFLTGAGLTVPQSDDSGITGSIPPTLKAGDVEVLLSLETPYDGADAVLADLLYAGATPGSVQGLFQLNARIPESAAVGGAVPVYVNIGRGFIQAGVTVAVR